MHHLLRKMGMLLLSIGLLWGVASGAQAEEAQVLTYPGQVEAACSNGPMDKLFDNNIAWYREYPKDTVISLKCEVGFGGLYLQFYRTPEPYFITDEETGNSVSCGEHGFMNEFVDMLEAFGYAPQNVSIHLQGEATQISEIRMFSEGEVPGDVQKWKAAQPGEVDMILFSTHSDDEHLFFAGLLPTYGRDRGYNVLVAYLTAHPNYGVTRLRELLAGLWAVGIQNYPEIGRFGDYYSTDKNASYQRYRAFGESREEMTGYILKQLRKYHPMVVVGHDLLGEYGHGAHMMYAEMLQDALALENDPGAYPELAEAYGLWETPKAYLHLYPDNPIVMDWDVPLESFDGMTAYEVSRDLGFGAHVSQKTDLSWYFSGRPTAASILRSGPREFGLYRSLVGPDVEKNDFFENVSSHRDQEAGKE